MRRLESVLRPATALVAMLTLFAALSAHAATTIYGIRGTATSGANDIIRIDPTSNSYTTVYDNYPGGNAATIAQCPDGLLYYASYTSPYRLYRFNPQTPNVAPVQVGSGIGEGSLRLACSPSGVLYSFTEATTNNLRIIDKTTGSYTGTAVTVTGDGGGGDIAFDSTGTLYGFNNDNVLFRIPLTGGAVTQVGTGSVTGLNGSGIGLAFTDTDAVRVLTNSTSGGFYSVTNLTGRPAGTRLSQPPGGDATGDLASVAVPNPDLSITKTANVTLVPSGTNTAVTYTIVVTNSSAYAVTGTITDTFPAGHSSINWTCAASSGSTCNGTSGSGNLATSATLAAGGTATYTVTATLNTAVAVTNTASVALPFAFLTDATPANNSDTHTINVRPTVTKSFGGTFSTSGTTTATITIGNGNGVPITTTAPLTDTLPTSPGAMTLAASGSTGTCPNVTATAGSGTISMASGTTIPAGGCTIIVSVTATTAGTYSNAIAAGDLVTTMGSNAAGASANVVVTAAPIITKSFSPATIASGGVSTVTITLTNPSGTAMTNATFTDVFPTLPGAMVVANPTGASQSGCGGSAQLRDSNNNSLGMNDVGIRLNSGTIPANGSCTITVNVRATVAGVYTNTIGVGALSTSAGSNTIAANATLTVGMPSFTVAKTVTLVSDPVNGTTLPKAIPGAVVGYAIQVTNSGLGTADNNATVVVDAIPANTALFVSNLGGAGSGPIAFVNGTIASGLTYTFTSLASTGDDVAFSNTGCSPFTLYIPVPDVNGFDPAVTCIRVNPKGTFAAASGTNNPSFELRFRVRVN